MAEFAMLSGTDHWLRSSHENTSVDVANGILQLAWQYPQQRETSNTDAIPGLAGLAFDPWCRAYHSIPEEDDVRRLYWDKKLKPSEARTLFKPASSVRSDFVAEAKSSDLSQPRGLVVDNKGRLFVADSGNLRILVFDLMEARLLRTINLDGKPTSLTTNGEQVYALVSNNLQQKILSFDARTTPQNLEVVLPPGRALVYIADISCTKENRVFVLCNANSKTSFIWAVDGANKVIEAPYAGAILCRSNDELVVARQPNADFLRYRVTPNNYSKLPYLSAYGYDGRGLALDPQGRVAYWSPQGILIAAQARIKYQSKGRLVSFRLDNQAMQTRWGRVFIDACLPQGTQLKLGFVVSDESQLPPPMAATPPQNVAEYELMRPDLTPPMPSQYAVENLSMDQTLHRRSQHRELPWSFMEENWRTYEAPVTAPPGRYLWLVVDLYGKSHSSPKIKNIRVEYPAVDMLRRLPRVFSEQGEATDFLHRYLTLLNSNFDELSERADFREILIDAHSTPEVMLPWLASLLGLELDQRWSEKAKRTLVSEAIWLFKFRGTVQGIKRFIEIYLDREITLIEHFQVRGLGGAFVGDSESTATSSVLGAGFRIGGRLGDDDELLLDQEGSPTALIDAISDHAHKFSVIVPLILSEEQTSVIEHILDVHRPAHTIFDICSVDSGMRLGTGLHIGMTSVVGKSSGFGQLQLGNSILGRTDVLGQAKTGMRIGNSKTGVDTRIG